MTKTNDRRTNLFIDFSKDEILTEFAKTLLKGFYLEENEEIQEGLARASYAWGNNDSNLSQRIYNYASKGWFMFASPVLSNAPAYDKELGFLDKKGLPISCFREDTLVKTQDGHAKISELEIGDYVLSDDGTYNKVLNKWSSTSDDMYEIEINGEIIGVTGNHLFMTKNHGWVRVDELNPEIHELVEVNV